MSETSLEISLGFGGGAELLFGNKKDVAVSLPNCKSTCRYQCNFILCNCESDLYLQFLQDFVEVLYRIVKRLHIVTGTIANLLKWMRDNLLQERPELFIQDNSVRPGILVLVNDVDWELMDTVNYEIKPEDKIVFISTLHGG